MTQLVLILINKLNSIILNKFSSVFVYLFYIEQKQTFEMGGSPQCNFCDLLIFFIGV